MKLRQIMMDVFNKGDSKTVQSSLSQSKPFTLTKHSDVLP